jgi:tetratricopeptide (TPR) repeat protein
MVWLVPGLLCGSLVTAAAQELSDVRRLYESGKYREIVQTSANVSPEASPRVRYLAAQSYEKLGEPHHARRLYEDLARRGDSDPWTWIGRSALASLPPNPDEALTAASRAVKAGPDVAEAEYQLGVAYVKKGDFAKAAEAFDRATRLDRNLAYAYYYAGLSYYRVKRVDLMAARFETFLKLAPRAPERPEVESTMRTVRGR